MASSEATHEARKLVTVLFSDLEESTQLGEQLDTELLRALLTEYFDAMASVVARWGGTVEKYIGDAVLAVFGIPNTHEDDAVRAVRAGLEMQEKLAEINPSLLQRYGTELAMRIGINTGEVIASTGAEALLAGDVFNVASRLEGVAATGTVVVGERTHRATESSFEWEAMGEFAMKGKSQPQAVWRVDSPRTEADQRFETAMVGRSAELGMLDALMEQAIGGQTPRLVVVAGDAGIGKSRLVGEFVAAQEGPVRPLVGRCLPYGQGITFWPLREVLWEAAGIAMDDSAKEAAAKLQALVTALPEDAVADAEWLAFALATTAGITLADNPFDTLSPESAGEELQLAWPAFASAVASQQPTVVVIEDLHWAERPLLDMIEQLAMRALGPLLIVATTRPEFMEREGGWGSRAIPSQISLGPLTQASFDELMAQLAPDLDEEQRLELLGSAGGNPFFAEELARHALDEGIDRSPSGAVLVPDSARAVLAARIDQLDTADREVLQDASVIGEVFWPAPLEQIRDQDVAAALGTLERSGFVTTRPTTTLPGQREMAFRHGLMCDVAYQSIARRRLATTHAAVAEWTEDLAADRRDEFIEVIAHHYAAAAQPATANLAWQDDPERREQVRVRAIGTLVEAGKAARRRFAIDQAVEYADRALALAATERERLMALELKAASYHAAARVDEAWPMYVDAIAAARAVGDEDDIARLITESTLLWARYGGAFSGDDWKPAAVDIVQTRLAEIGEDDESLELAALLTGRTVWGRRQLFDRTAEEGKADAERAIAISETLGSQRVLSHALDSYEMVLREEGFCELGELADRMVELGSEMPDRRQGHEMLITAAMVLAEIGRHRDSAEVGAIAHADAETMGVHQRIHGIGALTAHMVPEGMLSSAADASETLLASAQEDGGTLCDFGGIAVSGRALALFEQGRTAEGAEAVAFFEAGLPANVDRITMVELQFVERMRPFIGLDHAERLVAQVPESISAARRLYSIRARLPIAALRGDWEEAAQLIAEARELAGPACAPQLFVFADWAEAARDGDVDRARGALEALGEPYTAARLAVDFLGTIPPDDGAEFRAETAARLDSMGALASLEELRGQVAS